MFFKNLHIWRDYKAFHKFLFKPVRRNKHLEIKGFQSFNQWRDILVLQVPSKNSKDKIANCEFIIYVFLAYEITIQVIFNIFGHWISFNVYNISQLVFLFYKAFVFLAWNCDNIRLRYYFNWIVDVLFDMQYRNS